MKKPLINASVSAPAPATAGQYEGPLAAGARAAARSQVASATAQMHETAKSATRGVSASKPPPCRGSQRESR